MKPSTAQLVGGLLVLLGASPTGSSLHHLVAGGSSGRDEAYLAMLVIGGILMLVGGIALRPAALAAPLLVAVGIGVASVGFGPYAVHGSHTVSSIVGGVLAVAGLAWLGIALRPRPVAVAAP